MALNISSTWSSLSGKNKQALVIVGALAAFVGVLYLVTKDDDSQRERWNPKTDQQVNVITNNNQKNLGLDALAGRIRMLDAENRKLQEQVQAITRDRQVDKADTTQEREWRERFDALTNEVNRLRAAQREGRFGAPAQAAPGDRDSRTIDDPFQVRDQKRRQLMGDDGAADGSGAGGTGGGSAGGGAGDIAGTSRSGSAGSGGAGGAIRNAVRRGTRGTGRPSINVVSEEETPEQARARQAAADQRRRAGQQSTKVYIPAGSILTGTLITGADYPTGKGSRDNPTPALIRLSKQAILPNRFRSEVRECFMLVSGHGDLATERATLRSEMLSCVRQDGGIIQTKISGYVAGEDGKAGMKGRLVSKTGQMIARTLVAGFLSGMSEAFDYDPVEVLDTTGAGNHTKYQSRWSADAAKGGFAQGAHKSLERVADYYMDLADQMTPVVEITAGRQVDLIIVSGANLDVMKGTENSASSDQPALQQPTAAPNGGHGGRNVSSR